MRPSQGMTTFNQVCKYDFKTTYFPFFMFLCIFPFFMFFFAFYRSFVFFIFFVFFYVFMLFFVPFYAFYFFVVDKGVSLAPTYSSIAMRKLDLRSSL